jgi:hypothetical protein
VGREDEQQAFVGAREGAFSVSGIREEKEMQLQRLNVGSAEKR